MIAGLYYQSALGSISSTSPGQALGTIQKAIKIEPNEKYMPRYLSFQAEIEMGLGKKEEALESLRKAKHIIAKYPEYWKSSKRRGLAIRVDEAFKEFTAL